MKKRYSKNLEKSEVLEDEQTQKISIGQQSNIMELSDFLYHFYKVLQMYIELQERNINKIFNLYVIRTQHIKFKSESLKNSYIKSFNYYSKGENEVAFLLSFLQDNEKDTVEFLIKIKKRILLFYNYQEEDLQIPLTDLIVKISEWIYLLKSFPFFKQGQILKKVEKFKKHVLEENDQVLELNGLEFLKSTYSYYVTSFNIDYEKKKTRMMTTKQTVVQKIDLLKFDSQLRSVKSDIKIAKTAKKFGEGESMLLGNSKHKQIQSRLKSIKIFRKINLQRIKNQTQQIELILSKDR